MKCHAIFKEGGRIRSCEFEADSFRDAELKFNAIHPSADYYELGLPTFCIDSDALTDSQVSP